MKTPTQRSLKLLRDEGCTVALVERWNAFARKRQDLFGFIDLVALNGDGITGVQTTTAQNLAARVSKILAEPQAKEWLLAGGLIEVHGWRKGGPRGKRKRWVVVRQTNGTSLRVYG
jgi:hypothetical protein